MFLTAGILAVCVFLPLAKCQYEYEEPLLYDSFPEDFMWGVATSAFQVWSYITIQSNTKCDISS